MKALGRSFVWQPGMDQDIEDVVKTCLICQTTHKSMPLASLQTWLWPKHSWQRLSLDFATFRGNEFLTVVDKYSKWIEAFNMSTTASKQLHHCFAAYGLSSTVVTDGGPQFRSQEFKEFLKSNGVNHILTLPYHPVSNGLAERAVQTDKDTFLKQMLRQAQQTQVSATLH